MAQLVWMGLATVIAVVQFLREHLLTIGMVVVALALHVSQVVVVAVD